MNLLQDIRFARVGWLQSLFFALFLLATAVIHSQSHNGVVWWHRLEPDVLGMQSLAMLMILLVMHWFRVSTSSGSSISDSGSLSWENNIVHLAQLAWLITQFCQELMLCLAHPKPKVISIVKWSLPMSVPFCISPRTPKLWVTIHRSRQEAVPEPLSIYVRKS
jgi:hypothetical protein